jgi:hypothetical protein
MHDDYDDVAINSSGTTGSGIDSRPLRFIDLFGVSGALEGNGTTFWSLFTLVTVCPSFSISV